MALLTIGLTVGGIALTAYDYTVTRDKYIEEGDSPEIAHQKALEHITPNIISIVVPVGNVAKAANIFIKYSPQLGKLAMNLTAKAIIDYSNRNTDNIKIENIDIETDTANIEEIKEIVGNFIGNEAIIKGIQINAPTGTYTVQSGDTLWGIAQKYGLTPEELLAANPWLSGNGRVSDDGGFVLIKPEERIYIPTHSIEIKANIDDPLGLFNQAEGSYGPPRDPLFLDLDGDGIETVSIENGTYFDYDNNGFAEKTSWVGGDDGILVFDRNNNGIIDNGTELIGIF
ncbi:MAG: hypothetical protein ACD_20C00088G0002 [uncultured bacterium]|nr:MAG: hypothetical protein ACD_20C00088G0002 [uncultured bacterium]